MSLVRRVRAEMLDELPPEDPAARRSRRDLVRVHLAMGTRGIASRAWRGLLPELPVSRPVRILELGAGDGTLALAVARRLASDFPDVRLTLLDRQDIVADGTREAFAALGWQIALERADVLDWAASAGEPAGTDRWDLIATSLFLHHFEADALARLLDAVAARTRAFHAFEPRRDRLSLLGSHLIGALGTNAVTRNDAVLSVHAGFRGEELTAAWPGAAGDWSIAEGAAGPFGHGFRVRRVGGADA